MPNKLEMFKKLGRIVPLLLVFLLLMISTISCDSERDREYYWLQITVNPGDVGNIVEVWSMERELEDRYGELETIKENSKEGETSSSDMFGADGWVTKVRFVAIAGEGYKFKEWRGRAYGTHDTFYMDLYTDYLDKTISIIADFEPLDAASEGSEGQDTPEQPEPDDSGFLDLETDPHELEIIVSPATGGVVRVTTPEGEQKYTSGPEGSWTTSMTFGYTFDEIAGVTLTPQPYEGYEFVAWECNDYGVTISDPYNPVLKMTLVPPLRYSDDINNRRITTVRAYFKRIIDEEPEEPLPTVPLTAFIDQLSETINDESGCNSIVTIDYEAEDLTGGEHLISYLQLDIDGTEVRTWSGTPVANPKDDMLFESDCGETKEIKLQAINENGDSVTVTRQAAIPPLETLFSYDIVEVESGEDCQMRLLINYSASDLTVFDSPLESIVVTGNGDVWESFGGLSATNFNRLYDRYVNCGHVYRIDVTATDADGNMYSYRRTVTIPEPPEEPPDDTPEPPPVQTTLYGAMASSAQCTAYGSECSCQLSISLDGKDLTVGSYPVTRVILEVNGSEWHDSGNISQTNYHQVVTRTVDCGATFNMVLTVENTIGQIVTVTGSLTTPIP